MLAKYAKSMKLAWNEEVARLREKKIFADSATARRLRRCITRGIGAVGRPSARPSRAPSHPARASPPSTGCARSSPGRWERSTLSTEQLVQQLRDWCDRAEASGIEALAEFSQRLRRYAAA